MKETSKQKREMFTKRLALVKWTFATHNGCYKLWPGVAPRDFHEGGELARFDNLREAQGFVAGLMMYRDMLLIQRDTASALLRALRAGHIQQKEGPGRLLDLLAHIAQL